jgi:type 1 fimbria pilin
MKKFVTLSIALAVAALVVAWPVRAHEEHEEHQQTAGGQITVTGEILDMACYIDHGATGEKHAPCAKTCIESGLPVGIKGADGKTYLIIGDHKPLNKQLAEHAAKTITVRGKFVNRDGFNMIANAQIVK